MSKYLNESGLGYLWGKIKGYAVKKVGSTDNAIVRFDGTDGTILNSSVTISDNGEITAGAFKIENGTSSTFLKADGSFDSNTYAIDTSVVHKTGAETIPGKKTFSNGLVLNNIGSGPTDAYRNIPFSAVGAATTIQYVNTNSSTGLTYNPHTGDLKAASFTKIGGTSSQFLKADGSVDSNRYVAFDNNGYITTDGKIYASYIEGILYSTETFISDGDIETQGNISADGNVVANGDIYAQGDIESNDVSVRRNLDVGGNIYASGNLDVDGNITASGTLTGDSVYVNGGDLIVNGSIVLEGAGNGFLKANGDIDSNTYAGSQTAGGAADKAVSIPFGKLDDTSTSTVMTATIPGITELRNGVCMFLMNGKVTSASGYTININNLGAKPVYSTMSAATRTTTLFNVNYTGFFVFNEERVEGGCWDFYYGYNSDTNTIAYDVRLYNFGILKPATACQRYQLLFTKMDGSLLPVYSGTYTTNTNKTLTTDSFNPFGQIYYYGYTTSIAAMGNFPAGHLYVQATSTLVNIDYSFNTKGSWTAGDLVYIVCVPQSDGSVKLHSNPIAKELPTTEDGLLYIRIGKMVDATRCTLELHKPIYYFKDGAIRLWTGDASEYNSKIKFNSFTSSEIIPTINTEPGNYYLVKQTVTNLNIKLPTELSNNSYAANSIFVLFVTGSSTPSITITSSNSVYGESALTFATSTRYELEFRSTPAGWVVNAQSLNLIRTLVI